MDSIKKNICGGMYDIQYKEDTAKAQGVLLYEYPQIEQAKKNYRVDTIPGRDGELVEEEDYKSNITITCSFSILHERLMPKVRELKRWLSGTGKLVFSDTPETFYEVLKVEHENLERDLKNYGRFEVRFICYPYEFLKSGQEVLSKLDYNPYDKCKPIYEVSGEGACELVVNGKSMTANVGQNMTIDTRLQVAYRKDGTMMNTAVSGDYSDLWIVHGSNTISITEGFLLKIKPRWGYEA